MSSIPSYWDLGLVALSLGHDGGDVEISLCFLSRGRRGLGRHGELAVITHRPVEAVLAEQLRAALNRCPAEMIRRGAADLVGSGLAPVVLQWWVSLAALRQESFIGQHEADTFDFRFFLHQLFDLLGRCRWSAKDLPGQQRSSERPSSCTERWR